MMVWVFFLWVHLQKNMHVIWVCMYDDTCILIDGLSVWFLFSWMTDDVWLIKWIIIITKSREEKKGLNVDGFMGLEKEM